MTSIYRALALQIALPSLGTKKKGAAVLLKISAALPRGGQAIVPIRPQVLYRRFASSYDRCLSRCRVVGVVSVHAQYILTHIGANSVYPTFFC
jgi:hypothetical protein